MINFKIEPEEIVQGLATELKINITNTHENSVTQLVFNIHIPSDICLIRGSTKVSVPFMAGEQTIKLPLFLRGQTTGQHTIRLEGFSYQKPDGRIAHMPTIPLLISILANDQLVLPDRIALEVGLFPSELISEEWSVLRGVVRNRGARSAQGLVLRMKKPWLFEPCYLDPIKKMGQVNFEMLVKPPQAGKIVPGLIEISSPSGAMLFKGRLNLNVQERMVPSKTTGTENMIFSNSQVEIIYGDRIQTDHSGDEVNITRTNFSKQQESVKKCLRCQHINEPGAKYCIKCRAPLEG